MLKLETPVRQLVGIGPKWGERLERIGLAQVKDLLFYYPRKWEDYRQVVPIEWLKIGEEATIKGKILEVKKEFSIKKRLPIVSAWVADETGKIKVVWFNQVYLMRFLRPNLCVTLHGKTEYRLGEKFFSAPEIIKEEKIRPVYSEMGGVPTGFYERTVERLLPNIEPVVDWLPVEVKETEDLIDLTEAINQIHRPSSFEALAAAKERLAFDELFLIGLAMVQAKQLLQQETGIKLVIDEALLRDFTTSLPFTLTPAQKKAAWEIIQDMAKPRPMNRLLEGDVGSGKTVVAAMAALIAVRNGYQVAWMAPTEILAHQHYKNMLKLMAPFKIKIALLTGGVKDDHTQADITIGTHALVQEKIHWQRLGLAILDEQHRFGVAQRSQLRNKQQVTNSQQSVEPMPHLLSMTATPIPRTLALALYGDLDISIINQMPTGRQKVETHVVSPEDRERAYQFIREQVKQGRQVFVICPLIQSPTTIRQLADKSQNGNPDGKIAQGELFNQGFWENEKKSAISEHLKLSEQVFPDLKIGLLHGKLNNKAKEQVMNDFAAGKLDILVATAVVEVGIDVPNATVMMIEGAERFGLAQLHQFRGRVGRGAHQSFCLLFAQSWSDNTKARLRAMTECSDGFELAEKDLALRGPGELVGWRQSGLPDLKMASLTDIIMVKRARQAADMIVAKGLINYPLLREKLADFTQTRHLE